MDDRAAALCVELRLPSVHSVVRMRPAAVPTDGPAEVAAPVAVEVSVAMAAAHQNDTRISVDRFERQRRRRGKKARAGQRKRSQRRKDFG